MAGLGLTAFNGIIILQTRVTALLCQLARPITRTLPFLSFPSTITAEVSGNGPMHIWTVHLLLITYFIYFRQKWATTTVELQ